MEIKLDKDRAHQIRVKIRELFIEAINNVTQPSNQYEIGMFYGYLSALRYMGFINSLEHINLIVACNKIRLEKITREITLLKEEK